MKWLAVFLLLMSACLASHVGKVVIEVNRTILSTNDAVNVTVILDTGIEAPAGTLANHLMKVAFFSDSVQDMDVYSAQCEQKGGHWECLTDREGKVFVMVLSGADQGNVTMDVKYEPGYVMDEKTVQFQVGQPSAPGFFDGIIAWILQILGF